jgi:hypothetical protein
MSEGRSDDYLSKPVQFAEPTAALKRGLREVEIGESERPRERC